MYILKCAVCVSVSINELLRRENYISIYVKCKCNVIVIVVVYRIQ